MLTEDYYRFNSELVESGAYSPEPMKWDERFPAISDERKQQLLETLRPKVVLPEQKSKPVRAPQTYLVGAEGSPLVKIGYTSTDPKQRLKALQTGQPMELSLLWSRAGDYEGALHIRFAEYRVRGEWFDLTPLGDPVEVVSAAAERFAHAQEVVEAAAEELTQADEGGAME
jgi:hypothetical protein